MNENKINENKINENVSNPFLKKWSEVPDYFQRKILSDVTVDFLLNAVKKHVRDTVNNGDIKQKTFLDVVPIVTFTWTDITIDNDKLNTHKLSLNFYETLDFVKYIIDQNDTSRSKRIHNNTI